MKKNYKDNNKLTNSSWEQILNAFTERANWV